MRFREGINGPYILQNDSLRIALSANEGIELIRSVLTYAGIPEDHSVWADIDSEQDRWRQVREIYGTD